MHPLVAKVYGCYARVHEVAGNLSSLRGEFLSAHRTACLHHNHIGQATLLTLLLRSYLQDKLYDQVIELPVNLYASDTHIVTYTYVTKHRLRS